jgi:membrane associated rhomboid family serine protease
VAVSWEKLNPSTLSTGGFLHFIQNAFFLLVFFPILVYLAGEKT